MIAALAALVGAILYRLRGGWLKTLTGTTSTHLSRLVWALPTAALIYWQASLSDWWLLPVLVVSVFASMALIGHGAHMIMDPERLANGTFKKTELLTEWWIPNVFGGVPDPSWLETRPQDLVLYSVVGMSFIGLVRNALAVLPLMWFAPLAAVLYALSGLLHGPLYWLGWQASEDITAPECLVGAASWAAIVLIF